MKARFNAVCGAYEAFCRRPVDKEKARLLAWMDTYYVLAETLKEPESFSHQHVKRCLRRYADELGIL